jgi:hypothetical protein
MLKFISRLLGQDARAPATKMPDTPAAKTPDSKDKEVESQKLHLIKRDELRRNAQTALDFLLQEVFVRGLVIDSNVWMTEKYEDFFNVLCWLGKQGYGAKPSRRLTLPRVQFDEICLKKLNTEYGTLANKAARIALSRIEHLQVEKLLLVQAGCEARQEHGDPALLVIMSSMAADGTLIRFISEDVELRIRAREILGKYPSPQWKLLGMDNDVMPKCNIILAACKVGANPSFRSGLSKRRPGRP